MNQTFWMRSIIVSLTILTSFLVAPDQQTAHAADERCFPQTGQCINGRFRAFWEQNGGLEVFGYPLTPATPVANQETGQTYVTQWFERNRFEAHPENAAPYDVLLGRLGAELIQQSLQPVGTETEFGLPPADRRPEAGCRWFPQTRYNVCAGFKRYWEAHGLQSSQFTHEERSLALFGYPISGVFYTYNSSGRRVRAQYFERARMEMGDPGVIADLIQLAEVRDLGRLGAEVLSPQTPWQIVRSLVPVDVHIYQPQYIPEHFGPPLLLDYGHDQGIGYNYTIVYSNPAALLGYDSLAFVLGEGFQGYDNELSDLFAPGTSTTEAITVNGVPGTLISGPRGDPQGKSWTLFVVDWQEQGQHYRIMADSPNVTRTDFLRVLQHLTAVS
jgi:hypothetical protein